MGELTKRGVMSPELQARLDAYRAEHPEQTSAYPKSVSEDTHIWDSPNQRWVLREHYDREKASAASAARWAAFASSGCPVSDRVLDGLAGGGLLSTQADEAVDKWDDDRIRPWLVLSGPTGCGKSVAVAKLLWSKQFGSFVRADEIVRLFSSMFGEQYEAMQKLRERPLLVVDDVGGELDDKRMLPALLDLLDTRKSARSTPTIITTNLSKREFAERYKNDRLMSRMAESVHWAAVGGEDLRRG